MNPIGAAIVTASTLIGLMVPQGQLHQASPRNGDSVTHPTALKHQASARSSVTPNGSQASTYIVMIHSTVEPHSTRELDATSTGNEFADQAKTGGSYGSGGLAATRSGDQIIFHAIPYSAATVYPVVVRQPQLEVDFIGTNRRLMLTPNLPPDNEPVCYMETGWQGHEGLLQACTVYRVPIREFDGVVAVSLTLHWVDPEGPHARVHNGFAHLMLHLAIWGAPIDLAAIDHATTVASPLIVESIIDTRPSAHYALTKS